MPIYCTFQGKIPHYFTATNVSKCYCRIINSRQGWWDTLGGGDLKIRIKASSSLTIRQLNFNFGVIKAQCRLCCKIAMQDKQLCSEGSKFHQGALEGSETMWLGLPVLPYPFPLHICYISSWRTAFYWIYSISHNDNCCSIRDKVLFTFVSYMGWLDFSFISCKVNNTNIWNNGNQGEHIFKYTRSLSPSLSHSNVSITTASEENKMDPA